jgi:hypothetical protein
MSLTLFRDENKREVNAACAGERILPNAESIARRRKAECRAISFEF